jgi:hypothetical protein
MTAIATVASRCSKSAVPLGGAESVATEREGIVDASVWFAACARAMLMFELTGAEVVLLVLLLASIYSHRSD